METTPSITKEKLEDQLIKELEKRDDTERMLDLVEGMVLRYGNFRWKHYHNNTIREQATIFGNHITGLKEACVLLKGLLDQKGMDNTRLNSQYDDYQCIIEQKTKDIKSLAQAEHDMILQWGGLL